MNDLSHIDGSGAARMVDVGDKKPTTRRAEAEAWLEVGEKVMAAIRDQTTPKGNVFETARLAGILAAKKTSDLIPLCHDLPLDHVAVDFRCEGTRIHIRSSAATRWSTGVEMEALTAAAVAGLTLYDMLKALSKTMTFDGLRLLSKSGGRSGEYRAEEAP
ncbi:MAG TPA: cyclic pyranopterin monophosphate synthase MoaC [Acidobacteria bacterium]|nr:cyclic pyranopterin monophosphate synthase MoaC [Acidobacteriota bacterium]